MNYFIYCLKNYANFSGRARRSEYWWFFLIFMVIYMALYGLMFVNEKLALVPIIFYLSMLIPMVAVGCRRMHDVGKSGWFQLIPFYNLYLCLKSGDVGENQYGPDPKA